MTDSPPDSSHTTISSRKPGEHPLAATPRPVPSDDRHSLHDQQRELVRASLIARSPEESSTRYRWA